MPGYQIKETADLTTTEIAMILKHWDMPEWLGLTRAAFVDKFSLSSFRILTDNESNMLSFARINHGFRLEIDKKTYAFAELVGFVSTVRNRDYGGQLLNYIKNEMQESSLQAIGFCEKPLRPFYEKCGVEILYNKARTIYEHVNGEAQPSTDDDILVLNLSDHHYNLLNGLNDGKRAYMV